MHEEGTIALIWAVIRKNAIIYTVSVLIVSSAASIIFLSAIRRVFPVEIFLSMEPAPVPRPFILPCFVIAVFVAC